MPRLEGFTPSLRSRRFAGFRLSSGRSPLLSETDDLGFSTRPCQHHMTFRGVAGSALWLVVARQPQLFHDRLLVHTPLFFGLLWRNVNWFERDGLIFLVQSNHCNLEFVSAFPMFRGREAGALQQHDGKWIGGVACDCVGRGVARLHCGVEQGVDVF